MKAVILAAGVGSRIGKILPKCLTQIPTGGSILENQLELLRRNGINEIVLVVGFKKEIIMEKFPEALYIYNPLYHVTNTSKSLLQAMEHLTEDDLLWLNGDVYLEDDVLKRVIQGPPNALAVNTAECGEEEVKYSTGPNGRVTAISKKVSPAEGESVGVNKISRKDFIRLRDALRRCADNDYFERGIEICIEEGVDFFPVDISDCNCVEIDFAKDLETVKAMFRQ